MSDFYEICECCGQRNGICDNCGSLHQPCNAPGKCELCHHTKLTVDIPIGWARATAHRYGYDQIVIVGRAVGCREHVTTYGVDEANCKVAATIGRFLKEKIMQWPDNDESARMISLLEDRIRRYDDLIDRAANALTDSICVSGNDAETNLSFVHRFKREAKAINPPKPASHQ